MEVTPQEYHESNELRRGNQYVTFSELINELMMRTVSATSFMSNVPRSLIIMCLKNAIRKANRDIKKTIHGVQITVGPSLYFTLPQNYYQWKRISVINDNNELEPIIENPIAFTAVGYLQSSDYQYLFSDEGEVVEANASNAYAKPFSQYTFCCNSEVNHRAGDFIIDDEKSTILFSDNLFNKEIVIEYISDGLDSTNDTEITVHKDLKDVLIAYTIHECLKTDRNVPASRIRALKDEYLAIRHDAVVKAANFTIQEILNQF